MNIKSFFSGKKKLFTIPFAVLLGFIFLPITIGLTVTWFAYTKIGNKKVKYLITSMFTLLTMFFGVVYMSALVFPTPKTDSKISPIQVTTTEQTSQSFESTPEMVLSESTGSELVTVTRVIDGDTVEIEGGQRVRYIGIDTPELSGTVQCFAREAYDKNRELVEGKLVRLEKDVSETDKYGRLLRYVFVNEEFINDVLVKTGYANASTYPPDLKYQEKFQESEKEARESLSGLWSSCTTQTVSTPKPSSTTTKSVSTPTPKPTTVTQQNTGGSNSCDCSKTCTQISSCAEAQFQLNTCGCYQRDADGDGIACDGAPLHCQN